ncbi:MAG: hypothetical protein ACQEP5_08300 [Actinomycetota bacterium]
MNFLSWPHTAINMGVEQGLLVKALGANHLVAIPGNCLAEVDYACRQAGIEIHRIDSNQGIQGWLERVHYLD